MQKRTGYIACIIRAFCIIFFCLAYCMGTSQDLSGYQYGRFTGKEGNLPYRWLAPVEKDERKYPLVVFLHGGFEKGSDNEKQLGPAGAFFLTDSIRNRYPAFVLFPQCPANDSWVYFENKIDFATGLANDWEFPFYKKPTQATRLLKQLIDSLAQTAAVDPKRIYVIGISQGGMGVLDLLARFPGMFAAGVSICGAGEPSTARLFAGRSALWLFHGKNDNIVPSSFSRDFSVRLKRLDADMRYTEYPDGGHDIGPRVLAEPQLLPWLFARHSDKF